MSSKLFYGGNIITMEEDCKYPEAILVENGIINKIGLKQEVEKLKHEDTEMIDLRGKTLLPGFIDPHSHITAFAQTLRLVDLSRCRSIKEIIDVIKEYKIRKNIKEEKWIIGFGYDHNNLEEKRHPNLTDLDQVSKENPILISHISGHMGVANTKGLEKMKISEDIENPEGGLYGRDKDTNKLNGYLEENAYLNSSKSVDKISLEEYIELIEEAQQIYINNGITTLQDGLTKAGEFYVLEKMAQDNRLKVDTVAYVDIVDNSKILEENDNYFKKYKNRFKIGGYKMILDGSPQGKTAWLTSPYEGEKEYRGYPSKSEEEVRNYISKCCKNKIPLLAHCNGDAAADQYIKVLKDQNIEEVRNIRPVMIHAQIVREDQLKKMKKLNAITSFFVTHVYYWGDIHIKNLGIERASNISPVRTAKDLDLKYTFHQDTPVLYPNMLETVWSAVNRITKGGELLGKEQIVDVYSALKAITINAAYQYFEEDKKGSIKEGKIANLVILNKNPLKIDKSEIKDIKVIATFIDGEQKNI